jgi:uncharacterized membrane protein
VETTTTERPDARLEWMETELRALRERVARLERPHAAPLRPEAPTPLPPDEPAPVASARPARAGVEEWLGGRALGLAGGAAVVLGIAFLVATAIARGWLDEGARVALGFVGSGLLVVVGCWLHERRGHTQAARAAAAAGIAGLFATLVAATRLYDLLPLALGLGAAVTVGTIAVALAVRWESRTVGSLGIVGALLAPVLVGADSAGQTVALTLVTLAAGTAVVVWRRWPGIALASFAVALVQVAGWVATAPAPVPLVVGLVVTWVLGTAAALGIAARSGDEIPARAMILLGATAVFAIAAGNFGLRELGHDAAASFWTVAVAIGQVAAGAVALRWTPLQRDLAMLSFGASTAAADLALALFADGATVTVGYVVGGVGFAVLAGVRARRGNRRDAAHASLALGTELALAATHAIAIDAPPEALIEGVDAIVPAALALTGLAVGADRAARLVPGESGRLRLALRSTAAGALLYLGSVAIVTAFQPATAELAGTVGLLSIRQQGQLLLSAFWAASGVAALVVGLRRGDEQIRWGGFALLGIASAKVFLFDLSALESLYRVGSFVGLGLLLLGGAFAYQRLRGVNDEVAG